MDIRLDGRRAIVTGAASGIGAAIAQSLSESGALVFLTDRNAAGLKTVAESLAGPSAQAVVDFMDDDAGERVVAAAVEAFGGVDIVINCAGPLAWFGRRKHRVWQLGARFSGRQCLCDI